MHVRSLATVTRGDARLLTALPAADDWGFDEDHPLPEWAEAACDRWGFMGVCLRRGDRLDSLLLVATDSSLPDGHPMQRIPRAPGVAVVVGFVAPPDANQRWGRALVVHLAARLHGSVPAIEAGGVVGPSRDPRVAPVPVLESWGFQMVDPRDAAPVRRMRMDLRHSIVAEPTVSKLFGWLRDRALAPAGRAMRRSDDDRPWTRPDDPRGAPSA